MDVKTFMSGDPIAVDAEASALEALERMVERGIRHLPVLDAARRVVGVLSLEDLRAGLPFPVSLREPLHPEQRRTAQEYSIGELMTHAPETLGPDASLREAAELMAERRIGCLPIVDEHGRLTGLLSETDVLWAVANSFELKRREQRRERPSERETLVAELERERERLRARLAGRVAGEQELERVVREEPLDLAEIGADRAEVSRTRALDELALRRLAALDHALDRAARGELGVCERCGGPIPVPRLRALPGTSVCVACARRDG